MKIGFVKRSKVVMVEKDVKGGKNFNKEVIFFLFFFG